MRTGISGSELMIRQEPTQLRIAMKKRSLVGLSPLGPIIWACITPSRYMCRSCCCPLWYHQLYLGRVSGSLLQLYLSTTFTSFHFHHIDYIHLSLLFLTVIMCCLVLKIPNISKWKTSLNNSTSMNLFAVSKVFLEARLKQSGRHRKTINLK